MYNVRNFDKFHYYIIAAVTIEALDTEARPHLPSNQRNCMLMN